MIVIRFFIALFDANDELLAVFSNCTFGKNNENYILIKPKETKDNLNIKCERFCKTEAF